MFYNIIPKRILNFCFLIFSLLLAPAFAQAQTADLQITKTGPVSANGGDAFSYVLTIDNNGPAAANGATFVDTLPPGLTNIAATCTSATNGAACPASMSITSTGVAATIPTFPSLGRVIIQITGNFPSSGPSSITNSARVDTPAGVTDPDMATNTSVVSTAMSYKTDLAVTKTQSSNVFAPGVPVTYTMTLRNNGPASANGANIQDSLTNFGNYNSGPPYDYLTINNTFVSCTSAGGAVCPANSNFSSPSATGIDYVLFNTSVPTLPSGGSITIVYTMTPTITGAQRCGTDGGFLRNEFRASVPAGMTDSDSNNTAAQVSISTPVSPSCPQADLAVTKTQSTNIFSPGVPVTYTMTLVNNGPNAADGTNIRDAITSFANYYAGNPYNYMNIEASFVSCSASGGAVCPADPNFNNISATGIDYNLFNTTVPTLPVGGGLTIVYTMTPTALDVPSCGNTSTSFIKNTFSATVPDGYIDLGPSSNSASVSLPVSCADISVNKKVDPVTTSVSGSAIVYTIDVANAAGSAAANNVAFSDPLPSGFVYGNAVCVAQTPGATCGAVNYDTASRTVTSTISALPEGGIVRFVITGSAGNLPGTYANTAYAAVALGWLDPVSSSNSSSVNFQIFNTNSPITVTKKVDGLSAAGMPAAMTFTGTITCGAQAPQKWSATVAAGAVSGDSAALTFYDKDACTVTEDTPPAAPTGYAWVGTATIAPNPTNVLGPTTPLTVVVTNTLSALPPGKVTITKMAQTAAGAPVTSAASFSFSGTGAGVPATTTVVTNAGSGSQTIADLAAGQTYTWTENALTGWQLASIQCTDQSGATPTSTITTDIANKQLSVALASAEELVCTFTNRQTDTTDVGPHDPGIKLKAVPTLDASKLVLMMLALAVLGMAGVRRAQRR